MKGGRDTLRWALPSHRQPSAPPPTVRRRHPNAQPRSHHDGIAADARKRAQGRRRSDCGFFPTGLLSALPATCVAAACP
eukprot:364496-Chlamydomonas_euryale.AAC.49